MRVKYNFSSRRTRRIENIRKQRKKYPKVLLDVIRTSDIILEVLDARFAKDMLNSEIEEMILQKGKQIIFVLNKSDLVEKKVEFEKRPSIEVSCLERKGIKRLRDKIKELAKKIKKSDLKYDRIQVGVIGYPNSGKSSLINILVGKSSAGVGADAGFTKGIQKIKLTSDILLLDCPGVIPEKDYSGDDTQKIAMHAKVLGRSYSQIKNPDLIVGELMKEHFKEIENYYEIEAEGNSEILIQELGKKKNFFIKGGEIDENKTAKLILKDWQTGKIK